jgi:Raf kinase inhibitor-like YbhB/YbcL family protein
MRLAQVAVVLLLAAVAFAGCSGGGPSAPSSTSASQSTSYRTPEPAAFRLFSSSFTHGKPIPAKHTCDSDDPVSPALTFLSAPKAAKSLALTLKDPDVPTPDAPERTLNHWVVWNVTPASSVTFPEGRVPAGAREGDNDFGHGYLGPCPPPGSPPHHYNFTAYALDLRPGLGGNATAADLDAAMAGHVLARATLIGTYERPLNSTAPT